jgi:hypothetical protein
MNVARRTWKKTDRTNEGKILAYWQGKALCGGPGMYLIVARPSMPSLLFYGSNTCSIEKMLTSSLLSSTPCEVPGDNQA